MKYLVFLVGLMVLLGVTGCEEEHEHEHYRGGAYGGYYNGYGHGEYHHDWDDHR